LEFHEIFYNASGNRLLAHMAKSFIKQTKRYRAELYETKNRLNRSLKSHETLVDLFELNEPEKARRFRKNTLLKNANILIKRIKKDATKEEYAKKRKKAI
jgi:DNA-binding GntR family transcriptional regulator